MPTISLYILYKVSNSLRNAFHFESGMYGTLMNIFVSGAVAKVVGASYPSTSVAFGNHIPKTSLICSKKLHMKLIFIVISQSCKTTLFSFYLYNRTSKESNRTSGRCGKAFITFLIYI
jgi:hypothetical protein